MSIGASALILSAAVLQPAKPACQILTIRDVSRVVGVAVTIDQNQSGPGDNGWDFCAWKTPDGHFVILGVGERRSVAAAKAEYTSSLVGAFGGGPSANVIPALADEAQYRDYTGNLKGGVVVVRSGLVVFTVEAPTLQDDVLALARLVLAQMRSH